MQVVLTPQGLLRLDRPEAFDEFECLLPSNAVVLPDEIVHHDARHVWICEAWLKAELERASLPDGWSHQYCAMLAYAARQGWLRENPRAIRAHIVVPVPAAPGGRL